MDVSTCESVLRRPSLEIQDSLSSPDTCGPWGGRGRLAGWGTGSGWGWGLGLGWTRWWG